MFIVASHFLDLTFNFINNSQLILSHIPQSNFLIHSDEQVRDRRQFCSQPHYKATELKDNNSVA